MCVETMLLWYGRNGGMCQQVYMLVVEIIVEAGEIDVEGSDDGVARGRYRRKKKTRGSCVFDYGAEVCKFGLDYSRVCVVVCKVWVQGLCACVYVFGLLN